MKKLRDAIDEAIEKLESGVAGISGGAVVDTEEDEDNSTNTQVYVMGLPWETDDAELRVLMAEAGELTNVEVLKTRAGRSLGRGVVEYTSPAAAANAIQTLNQRELNGRRLTIRYNRQSAMKHVLGGGAAGGVARQISLAAEEKDKVPDEHRVFVSNLSWTTTAAGLTTFFETVGLVAEADVLTKRTGRSLGLGFVQFVDSRCVNLAIAQLNGQDLDGRNINVRAYYQ
jgi:RNA recognition motif-containing protein